MSCKNSNEHSSLLFGLHKMTFEHKEASEGDDEETKQIVDTGCEESYELLSTFISYQGYSTRRYLYGGQPA